MDAAAGLLADGVEKSIIGVCDQKGGIRNWGQQSKGLEFGAARVETIAVDSAAGAAGIGSGVDQIVRSARGGREEQGRGPRSQIGEIHLDH